jgi:C1A family cysteine protease
MRLLFLFVLVSTATAFPQWFHSYKLTHNKTYANDEKHFRILSKKYNHIQQHSTDTLTLRLNENSDRNPTPNRHLKERRQRWTEGYTAVHRLGAPSHFDWRDHHYVTEPKMQGSCGGCFAFAATEHLEFWYKKMTGKLLPLSIQQAMDCSGPESDGCEGGLMEDVYYHSYWNPIGPDTFDTWKGHDAICKHRRQHPYVEVDTYVSMSDEFNDPIEDHLANNLYNYGPIPVGVDSGSSHFELYHGGILKGVNCGKLIDHAVLVVGYTPEYWIIKNSWGKTWGQGGYMYLERGKNACGINSYAAFATSVSI